MFDDDITPEDLMEAERKVQQEIENWDPDDLPESQQRLYDDLEAAGAPDEMLEAVREGLYHDYVSEHPTPKALLVNHCRKGGLDEVVHRVKRGDYDP